MLPGAGTFDEDIARLRALGLEAPLYDAAQNGVPLLGIGLGMQLLFEVREAMDEQRGLGILQGRVQRFPPGLPALHMGWNQIQQVRPSPLWRDVANQRYAYFVHTDHVEPRDPDIVVGTTDYGGEFASVVAQGNVFGLQCHPEKSQDVGRALLRNFALAAGLTEGRRSFIPPLTCAAGAVSACARAMSAPSRWSPTILQRRRAAGWMTAPRGSTW